MIETIIGGLLLFVLTSVVMYFYKAKQLYVVAIQLYNRSFLSDKGTITEIIIYNQGNGVEENIKLKLVPELKIDVLASSSDDVNLMDNNVFHITRLHAKSQVSLQLLVENGLLTNEEIVEISSDTHVGKKCLSKESVPLNYGNVATQIASIITLISLCIFLLINRFALVELYGKYKYSSLYKDGWNNLYYYIGSDLSKSYSSEEFPIRYISQSDENNYTVLKFEAINKSALPINIHISNDKELKFLKDKNSYISKELNSVSETIEPLSKSELLFTTKTENKFNIEVTIYYGNEFIFDLKNTFLKENE